MAYLIGPSPAHYVLLAAIHRIYQPGPKTEVADWYRSTILETAWGFPPERFRSQDFWDALEQILPEGLDPVSLPEDRGTRPSSGSWACGKKNRW